MKKIMLIVLICLLMLRGMAQTGASALIPAPVSVQEKNGCFLLSSRITVIAELDFIEPSNFLTGQLNWQNESRPLSRRKQPDDRIVKTEKHKIIFASAGIKDSIGKEGYHLTITPDTIYITAQTKKGALNAVFTLLQLRLLQADMQKIPCAVITDRPRFSYRGLQLDVSRNFFPTAFIKKYIDLMALYKYNTFHWHLTDNGGWRLQIKKYPLLTSVAAFRTRSNWKDWWLNGRKYLPEGDAGAYGGFYTQEDAKEIVAYASVRGITVIPEIEMPAHSEEVLAVYPQLSCSGIAYKNAEYCVGNEDTFTFLEDVLTEVMDIFPSTYIHVGGDEASTDAWKACVKCQQRKKQLALATDHELQGYLIKRIAKFLQAHNRKLLGWDEIMESRLDSGAAVMNWRGPQIGIEAAQQNHDVIMTPNECYLDAYQSDPNTQPEAIGGYLPIQRIYNYEPVPAALDPLKTKYIVGAEACVWTEYMPTTYQVEYMVYPRAIALAETVWSIKEKKNFADFQRRLQAHYLLLQRLCVNYYRPSSRLLVNIAPDYSNRQDQVSFISEQYQPEIHFTTDGSTPIISSPLYKQPFNTSGQTIVTAAVFKDSVMDGAPAVFTINYHRAIGKKVLFNTSWSDAYPAQKEATLTNGIEGSLTYGDKQWLGYLKDFDVTVDMDSLLTLNSLSVRFMQQPGPGVFLPGYVEIQISADNIHFSSLGKQINDIPFNEPKTVFKSFSFDLKKTAARYVRIIAPNTKGEFMFADEVIIY